MSKHVCFLLPDQCTLREAAYRAAGPEYFGHRASVSSLTRTLIRSTGAFTLPPVASPGKVPEPFDGLALIGGTTWRTEAAKGAESLIRQAQKAGAICDAAGFLGVLGLPDGVRHTCNDLLDLRRGGGAWNSGEEHFLPQQAVWDGTIVTANSTAALEFVREFLLSLDTALGM